MREDYSRNQCKTPTKSSQGSLYEAFGLGLDAFFFGRIFFGAFLRFGFSLIILGIGLGLKILVQLLLEVDLNLVVIHLDLVLKPIALVAVFHLVGVITK